jgi:effector-binding domain-containing protein
MTPTMETSAPTTPMVVDLPTRQAAVVRIEGPVAELPRMMGEAFDLTMRALTASRASYAGHPFARYVAMEPQVVAEVGFPFTGTVAPTGHVYVSQLPGGLAVKVTHVGPYSSIGDAWGRATAWMADQGFEQAAPGWEEYLTGPEDPGPPITEIYFPIR